uniref:type IX secretion system ring protein PorN/GldN n=1 Tax=Alloprevotella sp. TaxID=1872471 RepID=UPI0040264204
MKKIFALILLICALGQASEVSAQPPRRRAEQQQKQEQQQNSPRGSSYREFPTAQSMPSDAAWRRDLYRTLDLTKDANAVLYYPTTPQDGRENLFTYLFKLLLRKQIKAYDYKLDGNEDFSSKNEVTAKQLMDRYHIFYESKGDKVRVNDADLPSDEVKAYFIKESTYYDQHTASFRSQVTALCPVLKRGDSDFGGELAQYPMFWVKMQDVAPYLGKLMLMGSSLNNAAMMSADDFFTMKCYKGDIYKAVNLQDRLLSNYCLDDSAMLKEQKRIEKQLTDVQEHVYGRDSAYYARLRADSLAQAEADSIAAAGKATRRTSASRRSSSASSRRTRTSVSSSSSTKAPKQRKQRTSSKASRPKSSSGGGLSVRRQRH